METFDIISEEEIIKIEKEHVLDMKIDYVSHRISKGDKNLWKELGILEREKENLY